MGIITTVMENHMDHQIVAEGKPRLHRDLPMHHAQDLHSKTLSLYP